ncbi:hypothetical protein ABT189_24015 [Streptomyces sp900105755]|uniref:hypothetical protein n=1 Tax=Streptomyces sp. 900105755 TaxID=3154389 RepID=UPI00331E0D25
MNETPSPDSCRSDVELQIERIIVASLEQATVNVRCLRGPVRRGARFNRLSGSAQPLDLTMTEALVYRHRVPALDTGLTAFVTLRGKGVQHLVSGTLAAEGQIIQGTNPRP